MNSSLIEVESQLLELAQSFANTTTPKSSRAWQGANVIITDKPIEPTPPEPSSGGPRVVVSIYHLELSWLFEQLRDAYYSHIDHASKIEFYGRLANAANRFLRSWEKEENVRLLLLAVLHEAFTMLREMKEDSFEFLMVAVGKTIADDFIERNSERGFFDIKGTIRFFANKGLEISNNLK